MVTQQPSRRRALSASERETLLRAVRANRCLVIRLGVSEFYRFMERRSVGDSFTMAVSPNVVNDVRAPTVCVLFGESVELMGGEPEKLSQGHVGVLARKWPLTAIEYGIKIGYTGLLDPQSFNEFVGLVRNKRAANDLTRRLSSYAPVVSLPPELSSHVMRALTKRPKNCASLARIASLLEPKRQRAIIRRMQADAIQSALEIFGLAGDAQATSQKLAHPNDTELSSHWLQEDSVIEHDARQVQGFVLTNSRVTGRAEFRRGNEVLEVITANRRPLEHVFGVDLIYHNVSRNSLVMVQYKMLNSRGKRMPGVFPDWIYRPDAQLKEEIERMKQFRKSLPPAPGEYRLNQAMYYLKFVRRDKIGSSAAITIPLEHFEQLQRNPSNKGPRGALRVSYKALNGCYLRDEAFFNLIRTGYIGAHASTTKVLLPLIDALVDGDRAVVLAIQQARG
jgi:hypothetical protein